MESAVEIMQENNLLRYIPPQESNEVGRKCTVCSRIIITSSYVTWELKEFCDEKCLLKYQKSLGEVCISCDTKISEEFWGRFQCKQKDCIILFCSEICHDKYKFSMKFCAYCEKVKPQNNTNDWIILELRVNMNFSGVTFCSIECYKKFIKITRSGSLETCSDTKCNVCSKDKTITIILNHEDTTYYFCDQRCLTAFSFVNLKFGAGQCCMCKNYYSKEILMKHTAYHENLKLNFCSNICQNIYVLLRRKLISCNWCQIKNYNFKMITKYSLVKNTFCCIHCLKIHENSTADLKNCCITLQKIPEVDSKIRTVRIVASIPDEKNSPDTSTNSKKSVNSNPIVIQPVQQINQRNVATMCLTPSVNRAVSVKPNVAHKKIQSDNPAKILLPVPLPIYIPVPIAMFCMPVPYVMPVPIPIPVPVLIPTVRNSVKGIMKEIDKIRNQVPNDPCEAELLKIADILAKDRLKSECDSDSDVLNEHIEDENIMNSEKNAIEVSYDLEWALPDNVTVLQKSNSSLEKGIKRKISKEIQSNSKFTRKLNSYHEDSTQLLDNPLEMRLDYTLGINAWKQWVIKGNLSKNIKFKTEILQMSPEELSYALCLFIQELRKPNGDEYAPDTIYYLCLGIQYYLDQNHRIENIFFDQIYEKFTNCLDEFARKFCALYDDESHFIVTRVEEEHLWETKQLGCYSPHVLLNTLIYFNTKNYYRSTVDEHMELSFYHILKAYKKNSKTNCVMLRFYPKSKNTSDRRVYEQHENTENPLRCPVKLYEYYVSKCPESVKNKYDMMYLTPEKYCVSDSPLWYSTNPLSKESLAKMVNRVKMVKEVNVALLTNN